MTPPAYRLYPSLRSAAYDNRFVLHLDMKHGRPECALECSDFTVRRAKTSVECLETADLVKEMYSRKGYSTRGIVGMPQRENTITLDAHDWRKVVGTVTVRLDSHESGLWADALYAAEIDAYRGAGRKVCEVGKLAIDPSFGSKELMASLFQLAYLYAHLVYRATDAFIEVNPRHAGFYKRMLGFREIGELQICPRVNAPAVLLHVELEYMREQISLHSGHACGSEEKTLYPYFLNCSAEDWIDHAIRTRTRRHH
jgi:hypothetical protein